MRVFPVFAIVLGGGSAASKNTQSFAVDAVDGRGRAYFLEYDAHRRHRAV